MSNATRTLKNIVKNSASESGSYEKAKHQILQGADIMASTKHGSMIHAVIAEERRKRPILPHEADNCLLLVKVLQEEASRKLASQILGEDGGDLQQMQLLITLKADCYQSTTYGILGLLGTFLDQTKVPIRIDIVKFLIENDPNKRNILINMTDQGKSCLSIAKNNPRCPKMVIDYMQQQLDAHVNQIPITQAEVNPSRVSQWIHIGANIEATDTNGNTVLCNAVQANNLDLVRVLLSVGSNSAHKNNNGLTPLQIAMKAVSRNPPLIGILESQSVNVDFKTLIETKKSELRVEDVQNLLERGANINCSIMNGDSPLHYLIVNQGKPDMVKTFINDFNADLSVTNNQGHRAIEVCILVDQEPYPYLQTILTLSKMTTDTFFNPKLSKTILQFAIDQKRSGSIKLIQDELNRRLWNSVMSANKNEDNNNTIGEAAKHLVTYGAEINHLHTDKEYKQWSILHLVAKSASVNLFKYMVRHLQADYMLQTSAGDYPISIAAQSGNLPIVEYLCELSISNMSVVNKNKDTPLHIAAQYHQLLIVQYLVRWGADYQAYNSSQQTPLDLAFQHARNNKTEEIINKKVIRFLSQLVCPTIDKKSDESTSRQKPSYDLDLCEIVTPPVLKQIHEITEDDDAVMGRRRNHFFAADANHVLYEAAKAGDIALVRKAIGKGADIRYREGNRTAYDVAVASSNKYIAKWQSGMVPPQDIGRIQMLIKSCQEIAETLREFAYKKLVEAIKKPEPGLVVAYHRAGGQITSELLHIACSEHDNPEIIDYLVNQSDEVYQTIINDISLNRPYCVAKKKNFKQVATYIKYRLTVECTKAIETNNFEKVKKLVTAGASVELDSTNNLMKAIEHKNSELVRFLCEKGARMPSSWLSEKTIVLSSNLTQRLTPEIKKIIEKNHIERLLRFAAANGNLDDVVQCQRMGVDINAMNCHGSTAVLCAIQHGNYFRIIHTLVSRGASILHSNENAPVSLTHLATEKNYQQIASYLSNELNTQFLSAILNNDRQSAEKFAELGADFNYKDEQNRTAIHYAVQYHGIDLVTWLCECGSVPTTCDNHGDYPIMLAVEKGDSAVVELFVKKYPGTKKQTNKAGLTALQISQKLKFHHISKLIDTGETVAEFENDPDDPHKKNKYDENSLIQAARNGDIHIIREFIAQQYDSLEEKRNICRHLIQVAKTVPQYEILSVLEPYFKKQLKSDPTSDSHTSSPVILSDRYKKILGGLLGSLNNIIGQSSTPIDPADPETYTIFFAGLMQNAGKHSKELQDVQTPEDVHKLIANDETNMSEQLMKIREELETLLEEREAIKDRLLDTEQKLFKVEKQMPRQRKDFFEEKQLHEQQLATHDCSIFLFQRQQEAINKRQQAIKYFKENANLMLFYRIIENRLQALFQSCLAAQGGYVKIASTNIPIIGLGAGITKTVFSHMLSKLDKRKQQKEWHNISMLGNVEELGRVASETAGLLTLYYREQIQMIDPSRKVKGSNIFNDQVPWLKQIYNVRPENAEEMAVVLVAEFVTGWIIDGLKVGTNIISVESLSQQLWLHVAKKDPTDIRTTTKVADIFGDSPGKQKIPIKIKNEYGKEMTRDVELRYFIGCVSVIGDDGSVYQYSVPKSVTDIGLSDLKYFGYVYIAPFSSDQHTLVSIVEGRKLHLAFRDEQSNILTRFEDISQHARAFINVDDQTMEKSSITKETARKVADLLREERIFVDSKAVQSQLHEATFKIQLDVDVLREQIEEKVAYYQASIDAAREELTGKVEANLLTMIKETEMQHNKMLQKMAEDFEAIDRRLHISIEQTMKNIEHQLEKKTKKILAIAETSKVQSEASITEAREAKQQSQQAAENSIKAMNTVEHLGRWAEQWHQDFQRSVKDSEEKIKQIALAQKQSSEREILDIRAKAERDLQQTQEAVRKSATQAKESQGVVYDIQKMMNNQLELHKAEIKRMLAEVKETQHQNEKILAEAREAQKQATRATNTVAAAMDKFNSTQAKVEKALQTMGKLSPV